MRKDIYRLQQERKDPLLFFRLKRGIIACCVGFVMFLLSYLKGMLVAGLLVFILKFCVADLAGERHKTECHASC